VWLVRLVFEALQEFRELRVLRESKVKLVFKVQQALQDKRVYRG
jgi:hypothetical protein